MNQYIFFICSIIIMDAFCNLLLGQMLNFSVLFTIAGLLFLIPWYTRIYFSKKLSFFASISITLMVFYLCSSSGFHSGIAPYYFGSLFAPIFIFFEF